MADFQIPARATQVFLSPPIFHHPANRRRGVRRSEANDIAGVPAREGSTAKDEASGKDASEMKEKKQRYLPEINNNLIEVSDWLTKIIVGLGLIELREMPEKHKAAAQPLATCLGNDCGMTIAAAVIIFFTFAGFLAGYINARTFVAVMFRRSDDELLKEVDNLKGQVKQAVVKQQAQQEAANVELQVTRTLVAQQTPATKPEAENANVPEAPDPELMIMAKAYRDINDPDYRVRVAKKDRAASEMLRFIFEKKISKRSLQKWVVASPSDGLIIAYASYVLAAPEKDDLASLLDVAGSAMWLHVKYRVLLALRALFNSGCGQPSEWKQALIILDRYRDHALNRKDTSLLAVIGEITEMIRSKIS